MTWEAATERWTYLYSIPSTATSVDFVFNDGAGAWDNNGGADWHVPVAGAQRAAARHRRGARRRPRRRWPAATASTSTPNTTARYLYLAAPGVGGTAGLDHFLLVARADPGTTQAAPWAKAGRVSTMEYLLGNEDGNNWNGWFDGAGLPVTAGFQKASGAWLEGLIDVAAVWGSAPNSIRVAFAGWNSPDGGTLQRQIPCGNGNGDVEGAEWITVDKPVSGAIDRPRPTGSLRLEVLSGNPVRGALLARVDGAGSAPLTIDLIDVRGRLVRRLLENGAAGPALVRLDFRAESLPAGVYFLRARRGAECRQERITVVR